MKVVRVIPSRVWLHKRTGRTASIYGALPYVGVNDGWEIVACGWTWEMSNGTIGLGRPPASTREEAEEIMRRINAR